MRRSHRTFALTAMLLFLVPAVAVAQEQDARTSYELERKSEFAAAALEALVPIVGHHYAGDARAGLAPAAVSSAGLVAYIVGLIGITEGEGSTVAVLGALAYTGGRIWGIVSALETAREFNRDLADRLGIGLDDMDLFVAPSQGRVSVGFSLPIGR